MTPALLLATLAPLVASPASSAPLYFPYKAHELVLYADLIVEGTIVAHDPPPESWYASHTDPTFFTVQVHAIVAGEHEGEQLVIRQFANSSCASRYAPYAAGQRAIFHLGYRRDADGRADRSKAPRVLSGGNEGEFPSDGEHAYVRFFACVEVPPERHALFGVEYPSVALDQAEYIAAARGLRELYHLRWKNVGERWFEDELLRTGSDEDLVNYAGASDLAAALLEDVLR